MPIHMRLPKLKGFRNRFRTDTKWSTSAISTGCSRKAARSVSTSWSPRALVRKNALVKVLGDGKLTAKVDVTAHKFSGSAREKITAAGGSATELRCPLLTQPARSRVICGSSGGRRARQKTALGVPEFARIAPR